MRPRKRKTDAGSHSSAGRERRSAAQHGEGGDEAVHVVLGLLVGLSSDGKCASRAQGSPFDHSRCPKKPVRHVSVGLRAFLRLAASVVKTLAKARAKAKLA